MRPRKYKGASYLTVICVLIFVSLFSVLMLSMVNQSAYQTQTYSLQMQAQYINKTTTDAIVQAMLVDESAALHERKTMLQVILDDNGTKFGSSGSLKQFKHLYYDVDATGKQTDLIGVSLFTIGKEMHDYYGEPKKWIIITVTTTIPDTRAARIGGAADAFAGTDLEGQRGFEYTGTTMVLAENPLIQLYNADMSLIS